MITETVRRLILIFGSEALAFVVAFLIAPYFINFLFKHKFGKKLREACVMGGPSTWFQKLHSKKAGTPTMGGILIWGTTLFVIVISRLLSYLGVFEYSLLNRKETYLPIFTLVTAAFLGAVDDYFNIRGIGKGKGLNVKPKMFWLIAFASLGAWWFYFKLGYDQIHIPGVGDLILGWWYIPLFIFIFIASANAVNITDGLDSLAGGLLVLAYACFGIIAFAKGLFILSAFCAVIVGATLAFLWFNAPPAHFYMGDTGSLALGATLGVIALLTDSVIILPLIGFIFVVETISVIIQLLSKKFLKKKVFKIAPLHHHFEAIGWPEHKITVRFWIVGGIFASIGLIIGLLGVGV